MKKKIAMEMMYPQKKGYIIGFDTWNDNYSRESFDEPKYVQDHWPEIWNGEKLIQDLDTAIIYATEFSRACKFAFNIQIFDRNFKVADGLILNKFDTEI